MLPVPFTQEDFDFVAQNGRAYLIDAQRQRIAHNNVLTEQEGYVLVSGHAKVATFHNRGSIPKGSWHFSCDHRWLGVELDDHITLHDLHHQCEQGFIFFPRKAEKRSLSIHPEGHLLATHINDQVELHMPDDRVLSSVGIPRRRSDEKTNTIEFSSCGRYLWLALSPPQDTDYLLLLEVPSLKVLDYIEVPANEQNPYDDGPPRWWDLVMQVWARENVLVLNRSAEYFLTLTFHRARGRKIQRHESELQYGDQEVFCSNPLSRLAFHPSAPRFSANSDFEFCYEWSWPDCQTIGAITWMHCSQLNNLIETDVLFDRDPVYLGDHLLLGRDLVDSGSLVWRGPTLAVDFDSVLPNGMFWKEHRDHAKLFAFKMQPTIIPVVIHMEGDTGQFNRAYQKQNGRWVNIAGEVYWVDTAFSHSHRFDG